MKFTNKDQFHFESYKTSAESFLKNRKGASKPVVLDLREDDNNSGRIDGSHRLSFNQLKEKLDQLPPFSPIIIYSNEENANIEEAAKLLWVNGFYNLQYIDGGHTKILESMIQITTQAENHYHHYIKHKTNHVFEIVIKAQNHSLISKKESDFLKDKQQLFQSKGIIFFIQNDKIRLLEGTSIDCVEGVFVLDHPRMKDKKLTGTLYERVQEIFKKHVDPGLASHGGSIKIIDIKEGNLYIELSGGCQGCGMSKVTLKQGIEVAIKDHIDEITQIIDVTDHANGTNPFYKPQTK